MGANERGIRGLKLRMLFKWVLAIVLVFGMGSAIMAQLPTATILGTVKDASGAAIAGVNITARDTETGLTRTAVSGEDGAYRFDALPVGNYEVRAEHTGFNTEVRSGLLLVVGQQAVVNIVLQVGATQQTVAVTAEAPLVNTTTSSLGGLVSETQIVDLPLNGRNYVDLTLLQTGISQHNDLASGSLSNVGTEFSSNGAPVRSNGYLLDGAPLNNIYGTNSASVSGNTLGVDGIREYKVMTNSFSAEYGGSMGSQMVILSKSGSNNFHGTAFDFLRNSVFDATNHFDTPSPSNPRRIPEFQRNNFGGAIGGPIKKDKSFFFANFEGLRSAQGETILSTGSPLTAGCRGPAGTVLWNGQGTQPSGSQYCDLLPNPVYSSLNNEDMTLNSTINSVVISPLTQPWQTIWPMPNYNLCNPTPGSTCANGTNLLLFNSPQTVTDTYGEARFDQTFSSKDSMFARYTADDATETNPPGYTGGGSGFAPFDTTFHGRNQFITVAEDHIFSPVLLNSVRASFSRTVLGIVSPDPYIGGNYSFNQGQPIGIVTISGTPAIQGFGPFRNAPAELKQNLWAYSDDVFYTSGKNGFKFGLLLDHYLQNPNSNSNSVGTVSFASLSDFYNGITNSTSSTTPGAIIDRTDTFNVLGFYIQDDYRATSRLTLNLGIRYEFATQLEEEQGRSSNIQNLLTQSLGTRGLLFQNPTKKDVSPRLGFAWDVFGDGKTALRGGAGLLYDTASWWGTVMIVTDNNIPPFGSTSTGGSVTQQMTFPLTYPALGTSASVPQYNMNQPTIGQYNLAIERQLPWSMSLSVAYAGSHGWHLPIYEEGNPEQWGIPNPQAGQIVTVGGVTQYVDNCMPVASGTPFNPANPYCFLGASTVTNPNYLPANVNSARVNPNLGTIVLVSTDSNSWYNSLQVNLNKRVTRGLTFQAAYTYSKSMDETNGPSGADASGTPMSSYDLTLDKAKSAWDATQNLRFNWTYHMPDVTENAFAGKFVNGWGASGILTLQTGYPFTVTEGTTDRSREATMSASNSTGTNRPNINPGRNNNNITHGTIPTTCGSYAAGTPLGTVQNYFDPCAYSVQNTGYTGDAGRDSLLGPGIADLDFSIVKDTKIARLGENGTLEFKAETFNIINHPNYSPPGGLSVFSIPSGDNLTTNTMVADPQNNLTLAPAGSLGRITNTRIFMREIQFSLRVIF